MAIALEIIGGTIAAIAIALGAAVLFMKYESNTWHLWP